MKFNEHKAIYIQIADIFCENILSAKWIENERIPSVREIAVDMEVNPNTALRSFLFLEDKGIIYNKRGIGYFVSEGAFNKTLELKKEFFINNDLPELMKTLKLLSLTIDDLHKLSNKIK